MQQLKLTLTALLLCFSTSVQSQTWNSHLDIPSDLSFPVVVTLRGNIHVIGGGGPGGPSSLHYMYDPQTGIWSNLSPIPYLAQQPAGAVVDDKIHICGGGYPTSGQRLDTHVYYDPDSMQWYNAAPMPVATAIHKAVSFDGKMYVLSGQPDKYLCEYYDPQTDMWVQRSPLPDANFWYGAIVANNNNIFRFGGGGYTGPTTAAHVYDAGSDIWSPLPSLPQALHAPGGTMFNSSSIIITGGYNGGPLPQVWNYDIPSQTYHPLTALPAASSYHSTVTLDSCVYNVGGYNTGVTGIGMWLRSLCEPPVVTGIAEQNAAPLLLLPMPDAFLISADGSRYQSTYTWQLFDVSGKLLKMESGISGNRKISGEDLAKGVYIMSVTTANGKWSRKWINQ